VWEGSSVEFEVELNVCSLFFVLFREVYLTLWGLPVQAARDGPNTKSFSSLLRPPGYTAMNE